MAATCSNNIKGKNVNVIRPYADKKISEKITQNCDYDIVVNIRSQDTTYYSNIVCPGAPPAGTRLEKSEFLGKTSIEKSVKICTTEAAKALGVEPKEIIMGDTNLDLCVIIDGSDSKNCQKDGSGPSFNGISVRGSPALFVIDLSNSMGGQKMIDMKKELIKTISQLDENFQFNIISFADGVQTWKPNFLAAGVSRAEGIKFVEAMVTMGGTATNKALESALGQKPSSIYLLSDGAPTDASTLTILDNVTKLNQSPKTVINCVGFNVSQPEETFLDALAKRNGGQYARVGMLRN